MYIDEDYKLSRSSHRSVKSTEDAVQQITDLLSISAFKHIEGREGHLWMDEGKRSSMGINKRTA